MVVLEHQPFRNSILLSSEKAVVVIYTISGVGEPPSGGPG